MRVPQEIGDPCSCVGCGSPGPKQFDLPQSVTKGIESQPGGETRMTNEVQVSKGIPT